MQGIWRWLALAALLVAAFSLNRPSARAQSAPTSALGAQLYELRVYHTNPGLLPHLHKRFRDHTNRLFVKHGMRLIGYWTPTDEDDTLVYILSYPSREAREASWEAFRADPEWQKAREDSHTEAGGVIVAKVESTLMSPTDYSPIR